MKTDADWLERALDDALAMTFPASDPVALTRRRPPMTTNVHRVGEQSLTKNSTTGGVPASAVDQARTRVLVSL